MPELITRDTVGSRRDLEVSIRSKDEGRGFTGIGVPYGQTIDCLLYTSDAADDIALV